MYIIFLCSNLPCNIVFVTFPWPHCVTMSCFDFAWNKIDVLFTPLLTPSVIFVALYMSALRCYDLLALIESWASWQLQHQRLSISWIWILMTDHLHKYTLLWYLCKLWRLLTLILIRTVWWHAVGFLSQGIRSFFDIPWAVCGPGPCIAHAFDASCFAAAFFSFSWQICKLACIYER